MSFWQKAARSIPPERLRFRAVRAGSVFVDESLPEISRFYENVFRGIPPPREKMRELQVEEIIFCLHLLDRAVGTKLGMEARCDFMEAVYDGVRNTLSNRYCEPMESPSFREWLDRTHEARQLEYEGYGFPSGNGPEKGTLFWEFAKRMDCVAGDLNPARIMEIALHCMGLFEMMAAVADDCLTKEP